LRIAYCGMNGNSSSASASTRNLRWAVGATTPDIPIRVFRQIVPGVPHYLAAGCPFHVKKRQHEDAMSKYLFLGPGHWQSLYCCCRVRSGRLRNGSYCTSCRRATRLDLDRLSAIPSHFFPLLRSNIRVTSHPVSYILSIVLAIYYKNNGFHVLYRLSPPSKNVSGSP
jgi:hypothetical protein